MEHSCLFLIVCFSWLFVVPGTEQLQITQTHLLYQLRKHLEYPKQLESWNNFSGDFCFLPSSPQITITCQNNSITELKIMGLMHANVSKFEGFPIPNQTLSLGFSIDSFITTLARLTTLRVLSLVSVGIWGPLSDKIHRLYLLEFLDLSSNFLYGSIPPKISAMTKLQTLRLDGNFFNDTFPEWFDSLSNLTNLSLKNNRLKGQLPSSISRIKTLTDLDLSHNEISGKLPNLRRLTSLHTLDLRENQINSELPIMPKGIITALLSKNSISGEIPKQFGELGQLQHLDLSFNFLQGTPPEALFSLPYISYLNLSSNMLSGSLPDHLHCGSALRVVDISINRLTGGVPSCLSLTSDKRVVKFGGNCLSVDPQHQHQESYCQGKKKQPESRGNGIGVLVSVIGGLVIVMVLLAVGILVFCRKYCLQGTTDQHLLPKAMQDNSSTGFSSELLANARFISQAAKLGTRGVPAYRLFSVEELKEATNNFHHSVFMGEGSNGKLYKGRLENGTYVAIRCLSLSKSDTLRNLKLRLDLLSKLHHPHLVCLLGHCIDGGECDDSSVNRVFLIYEYVPNGSLHTHLSESNPGRVLKWSERLSALIGIAKAVHFLHTGISPGFFNNCLKTNSILLDEHGIVKLSDYGLSIITDDINKLEAKGEANKSWKMAKLEEDVYSFGFILLETLVGPSTVEKEGATLLNEMTSFSSQDGRRQMVDPIVLTTCSQESLSVVLSITNKCISPEVSTRPSFEDVLWNLQYAAQVQATSDSDQRSDVALQS